MSSTPVGLRAKTSAVEHTLEGVVGPVPSLNDESLPTRRKPKSTQPKRFQQTLVDGVELSPGASSSQASRYPFLRPPLAPDEIGRLGIYRVLKLLGKGGMGFVFLAEDISLGRRVALKVMKPDLDADPLACQRFLREARTLARIEHEHLVKVYQVGNEGRVVYLAMEWLQGQTVEDWIAAGGRAALSEIPRIGREIALGLAAIHRQGVVHRDIKPANLWLEKPRKRVKILDFGLARPIDDDVNFTQSGAIVGTPAFMSPEQAKGGRIDARSDLFSLGGVLYYLSTGVRPFDADNTIALLTALAIYDPRPVQELNPNLPGGLACLIMQLLHKDPDRRPASAEAVAAQLKRIEAGEAVGNETEEIDFSCFTPPDEETPAPTRLLHKPEKKSGLWPVLFGLGALIVTGGSIALVASLMRPGTVSQTSAQQEQAKAPLPKEKKAALTAPMPAASIAVFLSELSPSDSKDWEKAPPAPPRRKGEGPGEPPPPPRRSSEDGVSVRGQVSPHGIFMHAAMGGDDGPNTTSITYLIKKQYERFTAEVSLNDGPGRSASPLKFCVYGDGKLLWSSREVRTQDDAQPCSISIKNVETLRIEVESWGDPRGGHAVWIEPRLSK